MDDVKRQLQKYKKENNDLERELRGWCLCHCPMLICSDIHLQKMPMLNKKHGCWRNE